MGIDLVVALVLASSLQVTPRPAPTDEFTPLFNGTTLDGWVVPKGKGKRFVARDGVLQITGDSDWLLTTETFDDFVLTFEARQGSPQGIGGALLCVDGSREPRVAYAVQVADTDQPSAFLLHYVGKRGMPALPYQVALAPADGAWHRYVVESASERLRVLRDGHEVLHQGRLCLDSRPLGLHAVQGVIEFRNVALRAAPRPPSLPGVALAVGGDVVPPRPLKTVKPQYPMDAVGRRQQGEVWLRCILEVDGQIEQCTVTRGLSPDLDGQALWAATQWTFEPATRAGDPVPVFVTLQMTLTLKGDPKDRP